MWRIMSAALLRIEQAPLDMRIKIGCEIGIYVPQPTPMICMLNVHYSRVGDLERPDHLITDPAVPVTAYRDSFGNWCSRLVVPAGHFRMGTSSIIRDSGMPDAFDPGAVQHDVAELPGDTIQFLLPSRFCESDLLAQEAWRLFGHIEPGGARVQAICDHVNDLLAFNYATARPTRTAFEAWNEREGVCRDFTHLAIAFCRAMNIPAKYCTGLISDIGQKPPYAPMDFAAWMRVWLGGRWHDFDPRNNRPMTGRVLFALGRDAADVPLTHTFGWHNLTGFKTWCEELGGDPAMAQAPAMSLGRPTD